MSVCFVTPAVRRKSTGVISCCPSLQQQAVQESMDPAEGPKLDRIDLATLLRDAS